MKKLLYVAMLVLALPLSSQVSAQGSDSAEQWLERLGKSLKQLNFTTSFVVVKNNHAEPYHWLHGITQGQDELEIIALLNGPRRDILRKNDQVSYIEPEFPPHTLSKARINGPIPDFVFQDLATITKNYNVVSVGTSRVLGRPAKLIRIEAKDQKRFGHWLWLDKESALLLKYAVIDEAGQVLEQIQFTHLDISDQVPETLTQLLTNDLPQVVDVESYNGADMSWHVDFLPKGFELIEANRHKIISTKQPAEFKLFNDGLVDISVYIHKSKQQNRDMDFVMDGATTVLNQVVRGFEVSVVGKVPVQTAKEIADSVLLLPAK